MSVPNGVQNGDQGLFSSDLIAPIVAAALPKGYIARSLRLSDYDAGFLDCLRVLTTVGEISKEAFAERYNWILSQDTYYVLVIEDTNTGKVVGTGNLLVERKLYDQYLIQTTSRGQLPTLANELH